MAEKGEHDTRKWALERVLDMVAKMEERPDVIEILAFAEWLADGSISAAAAIEGQRANLYRDAAVHLLDDDED